MINGRLRIVVIGVAAAFIGGCACSRSASAEQTPMDEVILGYKRALVSASEKSLFEEYVKYSTLGGTFALYSISELDISAATTLKKATTTKGEASIKLPLEAGITAGKSIEVGDEHGSNVAVKLMPIGNSPTTYEAVKKAFHDAPKLYELVYFDESGKVTGGDPQACSAAMYCVPINCLNKPGQHAFAYVTDYQKFRVLIDQIRMIPPEKKPESKTDSEKKPESKADPEKKPEPKTAANAERKS